MKFIPTLIIWPQLGVGGGTPMPRKLRLASSIMSSGMASTKPTMIGEIEFGMRWHRMMYQGDAPSACAARTNSFSLNDFTCARTMRQVKSFKEKEFVRAAQAL